MARNRFDCLNTALPSVTLIVWHDTLLAMLIVVYYKKLEQLTNITRKYADLHQRKLFPECFKGIRLAVFRVQPTAETVGSEAALRREEYHTLGPHSPGRCSQKEPGFLKASMGIKRSHHSSYYLPWRQQFCLLSAFPLVHHLCMQASSF